MKKLVIGILFLIGSMQIAQAQVKLSDYKYVIVEKQFHFQNEADQYDLNRLVRFLFEKHGFNAIIEGQTLPDDLKSNYCLAMTSEVKAKGALKTKATVILRDCENNVVYTSNEGISKVKEFDRAFEMAIRKTFESFEELDYRYIPSERVIAMGNNSEESKAQQQEIVKLKAEIETLKGKSNEDEVAEAVIEEKVEKKEEPKQEELIYYAKKEGSSNNYAVLDKSNKEVMVLMASGRENLFLVKDANAIVYQEDGKWYLSKNVDGQQVVKEINLQF